MPHGSAAIPGIDGGRRATHIPTMRTMRGTGRVVTTAIVAAAVSACALVAPSVAVECAPAMSQDECLRARDVAVADAARSFPDDQLVKVVFLASGGREFHFASGLVQAEVP